MMGCAYWSPNFIAIQLSPQISARKTSAVYAPRRVSIAIRRGI